MNICDPSNNVIFPESSERAPKDVDVDDVEQWKKQGWAFIAFIEGGRGVNQSEYHSITSAPLPQGEYFKEYFLWLFLSLYLFTSLHDDDDDIFI